MIWLYRKQLYEFFDQRGVKLDPRSLGFHKCPWYQVRESSIGKYWELVVHAYSYASRACKLGGIPGLECPLRIRLMEPIQKEIAYTDWKRIESGRRNSTKNVEISAIINDNVSLLEPGNPSHHMSNSPPNRLLAITLFVTNRGPFFTVSYSVKPTLLRSKSSVSSQSAFVHCSDMLEKLHVVIGSLQAVFTFWANISLIRRSRFVWDQHLNALWLEKAWHKQMSYELWSSSLVLRNY